MNYELMNLVSAIHEYKGKQALFIEAKPDTLESMQEIAKIQSTGASNRIEGIFTSDERLVALVKLKAEPKNRWFPALFTGFLHAQFPPVSACGPAQ